MALTYINIHGTIATGTTSYIKVDATKDNATLQLLPTSGATATVHYTATDHGLWDSDGSGAIWEPVDTTFEFTAQKTLHFSDKRIAGIRIASADEATTVDVLGSRP